ncbi:MAG: diaminopimelate epimerase [Bacteroidetes bacterium]|nr:MAG: diaminopimelate epimerase [Bacteroidota bacterium]
MLDFEKYHGNGNDFIIINNMDGVVSLLKKDIQHLCHRHFGIGADGLMLLEPDENADFKMLYYNSDGLLSTMCGNGGRCIAAFAFSHGYAGNKMKFNAVDGMHKAYIIASEPGGSLFDVSLGMSNVEKIIENENSYFLDTGSPHHVEFVKCAEEIEVFSKGKEIRNSSQYQPGGTNVDFVQIDTNTLYVRTYERGVEEETLSCGTGVIASALAAYLETGIKKWRIKTRGGNFSVDFKGDSLPFTEIWLRGPAKMVFKGGIEL